ncbi:hypothetical protein ACET3Z_014685 [Daucus carota]
MGSEGNLVQLGDGEVYVMKVDGNCAKMESEDIVEQPLPSAIPVSPDVQNVGMNLSSEFTSPKTVLTLPAVDSRQKSNAGRSPDAGSPCTPKEFDPFAPGLDDFMLAPRSSKYLQEPRSSAARSLNFGPSMKVAGDGNCGSDAEAISEEGKLLKMLYDDLLEVIVSTQDATIHQETSLDEVLVKHAVLDQFKTPERLLTGVASECPPAPLKFGRKFTNIDRGLCRKLNF